MQRLAPLRTASLRPHPRTTSIAHPTVRALSCFNDAVCFCDASEEGWPVLWANDKWDGLTGEWTRGTMICWDAWWVSTHTRVVR